MSKPICPPNSGSELADFDTDKTGSHVLRARCALGDAALVAEATDVVAASAEVVTLLCTLAVALGALVAASDVRGRLKGTATLSCCASLKVRGAAATGLGVSMPKTIASVTVVFKILNNGD